MTHNELWLFSFAESLEMVNRFPCFWMHLATKDVSNVSMNEDREVTLKLFTRLRDQFEHLNAQEFTANSEQRTNYQFYSALYDAPGEIVDQYRKIDQNRLTVINEGNPIEVREHALSKMKYATLEAIRLIH